MCVRKHGRGCDDWKSNFKTLYKSWKVKAENCSSQNINTPGRLSIVYLYK
jgi:hypothetical protein